MKTAPATGWNFDNTYARLPEVFFERVRPLPVKAPQLVIFNSALAADLGLNSKMLNSPEGAQIFAGNSVPDGAQPIAQAYAGHQFGRFTMLGDGRANLLGEHVTADGRRFDFQLKGSGPSAFSRRGDGRAALGPMLREYIISEAMFGLGIPTTRSLAVVLTGENVFREDPLPGAVLTRVAASHIRVGTFEYAAAQENPALLKTLADYTIARHYPELARQPEPYLAFLCSVIDAQARLIAQWMHVGFIHGVMNTDNMAVSGETIDYGPCAFMDRYSLATVFSSIDQHGRYAYGNQPSIAQWNLTRFAETLLPLLAPSPEEAAANATAALEAFTTVFERHWLNGIKAKLGLSDDKPGDIELFTELLKWMEAAKPDTTNTFRQLSRGTLPEGDAFGGELFKAWHEKWLRRGPDFALMRLSNPAVIPRNERVEEALKAATESRDYSVLNDLLEALRDPYTDRPRDPKYLRPAPQGGHYQTFCGT